MVDDEMDYTSITKIFLEDAGNYEVQVVNRGKEGYPAAKKFMPDIILLDISMPDISGYDVARQISEDPQLKDIPILFFSGVYQETLDSAAKLNGRPILTKPTSGENLIAFIENYLPK
jgi:CheY-like chemotaxis protein